MEKIVLKQILLGVLLGGVFLNPSQQALAGTKADVIYGGDLLPKNKQALISKNPEDMKREKEMNAEFAEKTLNEQVLKATAYKKKVEELEKKEADAAAKVSSASKIFIKKGAKPPAVNRKKSAINAARAELDKVKKEKESLLSKLSPEIRAGIDLDGFKDVESLKKEIDKLNAELKTMSSPKKPKGKGSKVKAALAKWKKATSAIGAKKYKIKQLEAKLAKIKKASNESLSKIQVISEAIGGDVNTMSKEVAEHKKRELELNQEIKVIGASIGREKVDRLKAEKELATLEKRLAALSADPNPKHNASSKTAIQEQISRNNAFLKKKTANEKWLEEDLAKKTAQLAEIRKFFENSIALSFIGVSSDPSFKKILTEDSDKVVKEVVEKHISEIREKKKQILTTEKKVKEVKKQIDETKDKDKRANLFAVLGENEAQMLYTIGTIKDEVSVIASMKQGSTTKEQQGWKAMENEI